MLYTGFSILLGAFGHAIASLAIRLSLGSLGGIAPMINDPALDSRDYRLYIPGEFSRLQVGQQRVTSKKHLPERGAAGLSGG